MSLVLFRRRLRLPMPVDLAPLRAHRSFRRLWSSRTVTQFGTQVAQVAILVQARQLTGSAALVGLLGAAEIIPLVICGLYGGVLADRADRRRLAVTAEAGLGLIALALTANALAPRPLLWPLYAGAAVSMALAALQRPSLDAAVPRLLPPGLLTAGSALLSLGGNAGALIGPALGGLLAATAPGPAAAYALDTISFAASAVLLTGVASLPRAADRSARAESDPTGPVAVGHGAGVVDGGGRAGDGGSAGEVELSVGMAAAGVAEAGAGGGAPGGGGSAAEASGDVEAAGKTGAAGKSGARGGGVAAGLGYAAGRRDLLGSYLADLAAMLLAYPGSLFPFLAARLDAPWAAGLLFSAAAAGAVLASVTSRWTSGMHRYGRAIALAAVGYGVAAVGLGLAPGLGVALACAALGGAADLLSATFRDALWNRTIPDELRGRLAGVEVLSYGLGPSGGQVRAGAVASLAGTRTALWSGGAACVAAIGVICLALPAFTAADPGPAGD